MGLGSPVIAIFVRHPLKLSILAKKWSFWNYWWQWSHMESGLTQGRLGLGCQTGRIRCRTAEFTIGSSFHVSFFFIFTHCAMLIFYESVNFTNSYHFTTLIYFGGRFNFNCAGELAVFPLCCKIKKKTIEKMSEELSEFWQAFWSPLQNMWSNHFLLLNCYL